MAKKSWDVLFAADGLLVVTVLAHSKKKAQRRAEKQVAKEYRGHPSSFTDLECVDIGGVVGVRESELDF